MNKIEFDKESWHILQMGAGGTGSALTADLSRLIYSVKDRLGISYTIADGDIVEEKNILRQNFIGPDLNKNKAKVLADRYSYAYGIPISYHDGYITNLEAFTDLLFPPMGYDYNTGIILLGCVDDHGARKLMSAAFDKWPNLIWIDAGNEEFDGQVVCGCRRSHEIILPPVTQVYPDILEAGPPQRSVVNCGVTVVEKPQAYAANKMAATVMMGFLYNILAMGSCETHMVTFDARNIFVKPYYIEDLKKKKSKNSKKNSAA